VDPVAVTRHRRLVRRALVVTALLLAPLAAPPAAQAQAVGTPPRTELRVLVVTDGSTPVEALRTVLARTGIPLDVIDLRDPARRRIDAALLTPAPGLVGYQGVVLPDQAPQGLPAAELAALHAFEQRFEVRQIDASVVASAAVGLAPVTDTAGYSGPFPGGAARLSRQALEGDFAYARGPVPFATDTPGGDGDGEAAPWVEIARPLGGFRTVVSATAPRTGRTGAVAGVWTTGGREEFVLTFSYDADSTQLQVLAPGLVGWLTRGVHLGFERSYLAVHVDDVLLPNVRWVPGRHCTPGADCPPDVVAPPLIRMTPDDVTHAVEWQRRTGFRLDLAFNGAGSVAADSGRGTDPLTAALVAAKDDFGWINHTWSHQYLGCVRDMSTTPWSCATVPLIGWTRYVNGWTIESEIGRNVDFARQHGLPLDASELVTGEHGGLRAAPQMPDDNPRLAGALEEAGIATVAADASLESGTRTVGAATTVPRHPIDLDFDTATVAETIDQYNWVHTSRADGGDGECEADGGCLPPAKAGTGFTDSIVPIEAGKVLDHVLANDPRPHYVHQPQLAEDRTLYPVLDRVIGDYRAWFGDSRPLVTPTMTQSGLELRRQQAWAEALAAGRVRAWREGTDVVVSVDGAQVDVPLTLGPGARVPGGGPFGEPYGTGHSAWVPASGEQRFSSEVRGQA
jgi:hypothetical protein